MNDVDANAKSSARQKHVLVEPPFIGMSGSDPNPRPPL